MLKKLHVLAGALRLRTFTVAELATSCQVSETTIHTVLQRAPQDWFTSRVISAGTPGGQPRQYQLTEAGEAAIRESIGRLPSAAPLAPIKDPVDAPAGLLAARAASDRLDTAEPNLAAALREEALESLDWAEAELADGGFPSKASMLRNEIGALRAKLSDQQYIAPSAPDEHRFELAARAPYSLPLPQALAGAIRRLNLADTSSWDQWAVQRLTPTQQKILQLLGSRDESLSLSAVARELGVTAATACDSVSALESKNFVCKQRSTTDGRALALLLTEEGKQAAHQLASLPDPLWGAFDALAADEQATLYRLSVKMLRGLQENGRLPVSRMCIRCKFFDPFRYNGSRTPHHCHRAQMPMADTQLRIDCAIFEAADAQKQAALWQRFTGHRHEEPAKDPVEEIKTPPPAREPEPASVRQLEKSHLRPPPGTDSPEFLRRQVDALRIQVAELQAKLGQRDQV